MRLFDTDFTPERKRTDEVNLHRLICVARKLSGAKSVSKNQT
jgi:hypothetical protein